MKVLVTGSNGLLGQSLRKVLGNGHVYHTRKDVDLTNYEEKPQENKNNVQHCLKFVLKTEFDAAQETMTREF